MDVILKAEAHLSADPILRPLLRNIEIDWQPPTGDVYEGLLRSICGQQLSVKAAATIYGRFLDLFPSRYPQAERLISIDEESLRSVGLSRQKAAYVQNVANYFDKHELYDESWQAVSDDEIIKSLTEIKGVGTWTVQMILMSTLGRMDVLPVDDLGIQNAIVHLYGLDSVKRQLKADMISIADAWSPYRSIACRYLWRYQDNVPI